jgi:hypothetical protein
LGPSIFLGNTYNMTNPGKFPFARSLTDIVLVLERAHLCSRVAFLPQLRDQQHLAAYNAACLPIVLRQFMRERKRERALLKNYRSKSTLSSTWFGGPASRHGSLNSLYLPFPGRRSAFSRQIFLSSRHSIPEYQCKADTRNWEGTGITERPASLHPTSVNDGIHIVTMSWSFWVHRFGEPVLLERLRWRLQQNDFTCSRFPDF